MRGIGHCDLDLHLQQNAVSTSKLMIIYVFVRIYNAFTRWLVEKGDQPTLRPVIRLPYHLKTATLIL